MKVAVLADIHGNLEALEAVLIAAAQEGVEGYYVLGDVVGYGPDPLACLYRLRELEAVCVMGNHDQAMVDLRCLRELNTLARQALLESRPALGATEFGYLRSWPYRHVAWGGVFSHANPVRPEEWQHLFLYEHVAWCLDRLDWKVAFVGHTHHQGIYCQLDGQIVALTSAEVAVGRHRYLVNPGSVGQPRDRDWRAAFAVWDLGRSHVKLQRVEYPVQCTQEKMGQAGWPGYLVERLGQGE
jgi:predicted phosphodiesterase